MGAIQSCLSVRSANLATDQKKTKKRPCSSKAPFIPECQMIPEGTSLETVYAGCTKNKGHENFVPVKTFLSADEDNIRQLIHKMLPQRSDKDFIVILNKKDYKLIHDYVRVLSPITNRVVANYTSHERPDLFPGTNCHYPYCEDKGKQHNEIPRFATGTLLTTLIPVSENSSLTNPHEPQSPNKKYWLGLVLTATHAVCDLDEAKCSKFEFFYDEEDSIKNQEIRTLNGTDLTVSDFIVYCNQYREDESAPDSHRFPLEINSFMLSSLEQISKYQFAGDMNVIVCKTEDEETATCLSDAWIDWKSYRLSLSSQSTRDLLYKFPTIVSHPHSGPKLVSIGCKSSYDSVSVKECINNDNIFLDSLYTDFGQVNKLWKRRYMVTSNTRHDLFPLWSYLHPPSPFDEDSDLVGDADMVTMPARTEVRLIDGSDTRYCLWRDVIVPRKSLYLAYCYIETRSNPTSNKESGFTSTNTHTNTHNDTQAEVSNKANTNTDTQTDSSTNRNADTHDDRQFNIAYEVTSNTSSDLLPVKSFVFTPVALDKNHLVPDTDLVRLPAKTHVWIRKGLSGIKYSLRRDTYIQTDSLSVFSNKYLTYNTPTCPGSSGAFVPSVAINRRFDAVFFSHSGRSEGGKNKSGIRTN